jgi:hypothetical protein
MLYAAIVAARTPPSAWTAPFNGSFSPLLQNVRVMDTLRV